MVSDVSGIAVKKKSRRTEGSVVPAPRKAATPMTVAQFHRRERKKTKKIRRLVRTFPALWPDIDNGKFRPVMTGIKEQMLTYIAGHPDCGLTGSQCVAGLISAVKQEAYYASFSRGAFRYDIHGNPAGTVTGKEAADAALKVKRYRDIRIRISDAIGGTHSDTGA